MMRRRLAYSGGVGLVALAMAWAGAACVDLFHSTDFETLCGVDAAACARKEAGRPEAAPDVFDAGPTDFCVASSATARSRAEHACAWLGACTVPFDHNAFGTCMIDAILAYDCNANPNLTIAPGPLHDYWDALWQVTSCAEVDHLINPNGIGCSLTGFACAGGMEPNVYFECVDGGGGPETCLAQGRVCGSNAGCAPAGASSPCVRSSCKGSVLHDCEGSMDLGRDCSGVGAGTCGATDAGYFCQPSLADGGLCPETQAVACDTKNNKALACPAGQFVSIDCAVLTGPSTCKAGTPTPIWNLAAQCQGSGCKEGCDGGTLIGCAQGAAFTTSCANQGLGLCHEVALADPPKGFACKPPASR